MLGKLKSQEGQQKNANCLLDLVKSGFAINKSHLIITVTKIVKDTGIPSFIHKPTAWPEMVNELSQTQNFCSGKQGAPKYYNLKINNLAGIMRNQRRVAEFAET